MSDAMIRISLVLVLLVRFWSAHLQMVHELVRPSQLPSVLA
jgi:hypothetical protein